MDRQAFVEWMKQQPYLGPGYQRDEEKKAAALFASVDRFQEYLEKTWNCPALVDAPAEAVRQFDFQDRANDDMNLANLFKYLGREDLLPIIRQIAARKYFRRKSLPAALKDLSDLREPVKTLQRAGIRMASQLLEQGATPAQRAALAERTGLPAETLLRMVHACDLCRMTGMSGQALRRSIAMGYGTLASYRAISPETARETLKRYLQETGERSNAEIDFAWFANIARELEDVVVE